MTAHVIRLRGFWTAEGGQFRRNFGRPRTLAAGETAWLVGTTGPGRVFLNDHLLGELQSSERFAFDVTAALLPRNVAALEAVVEPTDVSLEIRPPAPALPHTVAGGRQPIL